ncbi:hypothetical protein FACS1894218_6360 [Bacilli bacterium]|nr:hypothetical protein FACS1894218_6360 [Bacilli bacterium]
MKYHTKEQTRKTYLDDATLQREAKVLLADWKSTVLTLIVNGVFQIVMYTTLYSALCLLDTEGVNSTSNFAHIFNVANVINVANKYLPIPGGGEGLAQ